MTAAVLIISGFAGWIWFNNYGPMLIGGVTIYTATYVATTFTAAIFAVKSKDRSIIAAGCCIVGYTFVAPFVYSSPNALLWCAGLDLLMACYFIGLGAKRFEIYAGLFFLLAVATTAMSFGPMAWIPSHIDRPYMFIAFSQPDITAICGHAANIIIGFSAGDGGRRIRDYLSSRLYVGDFGRGLGFVLFSNVQTEQKEGTR